MTFTSYVANTDGLLGLVIDFSFISGQVQKQFSDAVVIAEDLKETGCLNKFDIQYNTPKKDSILAPQRFISNSLTGQLGQIAKFANLTTRL